MFYKVAALTAAYMSLHSLFNFSLRSVWRHRLVAVFDNPNNDRFECSVPKKVDTDLDVSLPDLNSLMRQSFGGREQCYMLRKFAKTQGRIIEAQKLNRRSKRNLDERLATTSSESDLIRLEHFCWCCTADLTMWDDCLVFLDKFIRARRVETGDRLLEGMTYSTLNVG